MVSSLTWSESKGSNEATQFAGGDYDVFPDDFVNRFGYLSDHRRWRFKLNGYVQLPRRFTLGFDGFWSSPYVFNVTDAANSTGNDVLFVERRGSRQGNDTYQLDLQLAGKELPFELGVLAHVRGHHLPDLAGPQHEAQAPVVDAAVVRHHGQVLHAAADERGDEVLRDPAETEAAHHEQGAVRHVAHGFVRGRNDFVHHRRSDDNRAGVRSVNVWIFAKDRSDGRSSEPGFTLSQT